MDENALSKEIIGAAIDVHRALGPGLLESVYEECLCREIILRNIEFERQVSIPVQYKGVKLECAYKLDILVDDKVVVEIKSVEQVTPVHFKQLLTYLRLTDKKLGLLINFNEEVVRKGVHRIVNGLLAPLTKD
ncbi:MAG TPA: GxxExxY protein [bacterium]|nr:GxxExxY protein [bacterium]